MSIQPAPEPASPPPRFPRWPYIAILAVIIVLAIAPVVVAVVSGNIAAAHGCAVDEGSVHPCLIGGTDYGELFYTLGVSGWLMLATIPLGFGAVVILLVVLLIHLATFRRRARTAATGATR
jgi:hypothetical protein